uniref:Uncharacterized protein n=1 Tax=Caenorhabditis japonica TaxID=281687 RepID=A0A8R1DVG0_CAEJA
MHIFFQNSNFFLAISNLQHITPLVLHLIIEMISEIKKNLQDESPTELITENERDAMNATALVTHACYIEGIVKLTAQAKLYWATEDHVKRRIDLIFYSWNLLAISNLQHITPLVLHLIIEMISEIKKNLQDECPTELITENERDAMNATELVMHACYIEIIVKLTAQAKLYWATEHHVKRRIDLIFYGWKMLLLQRWFLPRFASDEAR